MLTKEELIVAAVRMQSELADIARQLTSDVLSEGGDYEGAYDFIVRKARDVLADPAVQKLDTLGKDSP